MKSILFYSGHCEIVGGDAKYLFDLINELHKKSYRIVLLTDTNPVFESRAKQWLKAPIEITYLETYPKLFSRSFLQRFADHLKMTTPTLWNMFNHKIKNKTLWELLFFSEKIITLSWFFGMLKNIRIFSKVLSEHRHVDIFHFNNGSYPGKEAGICALAVAYFLKIPKRVMTVHNIPIRKSKVRIVQWLIDFVVMKTCNQIITASENIRKDLMTMRGLPGERIQTIYCGLENFPLLDLNSCLSLRQQLGISETAKIIGLCGNLDEERKGFRFTMDALALLTPEHPNLVLVIVGGGRKESLEALQNYATLKGLLVFFLGHREDIHSINSIFDIAVVPSLLAEATPYTIKEAARAGRPVITSTAGGCPYGVEDQKTGIIFPAQDLNGFCNALRKLLQNDPLRFAMGEEAKGFFLKTFHIDKQMDRHEAYYSST